MCIDKHRSERLLHGKTGSGYLLTANYVAATACGADACLQPGESENVVTEMAYNADGNILTLTAKNPSTGDQVTTYVYGTTLADSDIARNDLMRAVIYPDSGDGADQVTYRYNRQQGQITSKTDQNGSEHEYDFDALGRQTADKVTTLGSGVDGDIRRIDTAYEVRGKVQTVTSYDAATGGNVVNEVENEYNDFVQLDVQHQEHDGAVDGSTLSVGYAYVDGTGNTARPISVTYPDGRVLSFVYWSNADDQLSRISRLNWNGTEVSRYGFLGAGTIVEEEYLVPQVTLDYIGAGHAYSGLDRFGRVVDQIWTGVSGDVDRFQYGYDRNSNRVYRTNVVSSSQPTPVHFDELYGYDRLNRLTSAHRGELINNDRITDHKLSQAWELDSTGNWKQFSNYDQATADDVLVQQRTHNEVNEITAIGETVGDQWVTPQHDRNGNMTTIPQPSEPTQSFTCIWDAWNRMVEVMDGANTIGRYDYDGLGRRIRKYVPGSPDSYQHFYFNADWQLLETREASTAPVAATAQYQYVWSLRYIDAPVLRDDRAASPDEVLYYLGDANFNVTTLIDTSGDAVERYVYDPYGTLTIYNANWSATRTSSQYDNSTLFTGRWLDEETGLYYYRSRYLNASLGIFVSRDLLLYLAGRNLYSLASGNPINRVDPIGLKECKCGMDITAQLGAIRTTVKAKFAGLERVEVVGVCNSLVTSTGWDIEELALSGHPRTADKPAGGVYPFKDEASDCGTDECEGSVTVNGKCYWAAEVNYWLFGSAMRICYDWWKSQPGSYNNNCPSRKFQPTCLRRAKMYTDVPFPAVSEGPWRHELVREPIEIAGFS